MFCESGTICFAVYKSLIFYTKFPQMSFYCIINKILINK